MQWTIIENKFKEEIRNFKVVLIIRLLRKIIIYNIAKGISKDGINSKAKKIYLWE